MDLTNSLGGADSGLHCSRGSCRVSYGRCFITASVDVRLDFWPSIEIISGTGKDEEDNDDDVLVHGRVDPETSIFYFLLMLS